MSLDGLRAWIGLVERKLTMRTRVFLVLVAVAVGGAGAAVYLALDAREDAVSKSDLQTVRDELAGETGAPSGGVTSLEAQIEVLRAEIAELKAEGESAGKSPGADSTTPAKPDGGTGTTGGSGAGGAGDLSGGPPVPKAQAQLEALGEKAEEAKAGE